MSYTLWELGPSAWQADEQIIRVLLRDGDTYIDVGANIGSLTIVGKNKVGLNGKVIAIEAHPKTFYYLKENILFNNICVDIYNLAIGESSGTLRITDNTSDDKNAVATATENGLSIEVLTLDDLLKGVGHIRLLKVDVEGFELAVFRGASELLKRTDMVYFESFDEQSARYGFTTRDLIQQVEQAGFSIYPLSGWGIFYPLTASGIEPTTTSHSSVKCENLLAIADGCADKAEILKSITGVIQAWDPGSDAKKL
jgi:FkbM family methyltransferase